MSGKTVFLEMLLAFLMLGIGGGRILMVSYTSNVLKVLAGFLDVGAKNTLMGMKGAFFSFLKFSHPCWEMDRYVTKDGMAVSRTEPSLQYNRKISLESTAENLFSDTPFVFISFIH